MRNVFKGYQVSKMAVPKTLASSIQKDFDVHHAPSLSRGVLRLPNAVKVAKRIGRIGKNPGVR